MAAHFLIFNGLIDWDGRLCWVSSFQSVGNVFHGGLFRLSE